MKRWRTMTALATVLAAAGVCAPAAAQEREVRLAVFDTGAHSAAPLADAAVAAQAGWTALSADEKGHAFKGDAVLATDRVALVFRTGAEAVEVYGRSGDAARLRGRVAPLGAAGAKLAEVKVAEIGRGGAAVLASFAGGDKSAALAFSVTRASPLAKVEAKAGAAGLRIEAPCRLGVMPDFFADDMVIDARAIPIDRTELPSENFFMQMLGGGESILAAIWDKGEADIQITLAGEGEKREISGVEIPFSGGSIWLAALEGKGVWATAELTDDNVKQVTALDWVVPYDAKWKGDFVRADHTVDSWAFDHCGSRNRRRWSGVVGGYMLPCWFDEKDGKLAGSIQAATSFPNGQFAGPFVVYAIDRAADTPRDQFTITDLMRSSLGQGPCEYIMDVAGQGVSDKGVFTCAVDAMIPAIFAAGRQKEERVFIHQMLVQVQIFVKAIRDRINAYVDFRTETLAYLAEQKKAHPELAEFIGRLEAQTKKIQAQKVDRMAEVGRLVEQIEAEAISDTPRPDINRLTAEGTGGIATHGGWQDDVVARCRNAVKILRQMATIEMAINPKSAEVAREIRERTQKILRSPLGHEMR